VVRPPIACRHPMIEEPPLLTIRTERLRPDEAQLTSLRDVPTGFLADAMNGRGALPTTIRHLSPGVLPTRFFGSALTCQCGPADVLAVFAALGEVRPGDILVAATGAWPGCAVIGDRVMGMLRNAGGSAFITDGLVRDIEGIEPVGLPLMCAGVSPNSPFANGPGEIGFRVSLGDVSIDSGDVIVADDSGAVVVPSEQLDAVIARLPAIRKLEAALDARVADGLIMPDSTRELLASDRVKRI